MMADPSNELLLLGQSAAGAMVQAMVVEGWNQARSLLVRWFGRGGTEEAARQEQRLDRDRAILVAEPEAADRIRQEWMIRLVDWLEDHPESATELKDLLQAVEGLHPTDSTSTSMVVHQHADHGSTNQVAGRDVNNYHGTTT